MTFIGKWIANEEGKFQCPADGRGYLHVSVVEHTEERDGKSVLKLSHAIAHYVMGNRLATAPQMPHPAAMAFTAAQTAERKSRLAHLIEETRAQDEAVPDIPEEVARNIVSSARLTDPLSAEMRAAVQCGSC